MATETAQTALRAGTAPLRVLRPASRDCGTTQTPGMQREAGVSLETTGAEQLWMGHVTVAPGRGVGRASSWRLRIRHLHHLRPGSLPFGTGLVGASGRRPRRLHLCPRVGTAPGDQPEPNRAGCGDCLPHRHRRRIGLQRGGREVAAMKGPAKGTGQSTTG